MLWKKSWLTWNLVFFFTLSAKAETQSIFSFGAVPDGKTLNTKAINACIEKVYSKGGGYVVVPGGVFLSGTIELKSNVFLQLEPGAILKGSSQIHDYKRFDGHRFDKYLFHLVTSKNAQNTGIIGQGIIDGNGTAFWEPFSEAEMPAWIKAKDPRVSRLVEFTNCKNI